MKRQKQDLNTSLSDIQICDLLCAPSTKCRQHATVGKSVSMQGGQQFHIILVIIVTAFSSRPCFPWGQEPWVWFFSASLGPELYGLHTLAFSLGCGQRSALVSSTIKWGMWSSCEAPDHDGFSPYSDCQLTVNSFQVVPPSTLSSDPQRTPKTYKRDGIIQSHFTDGEKRFVYITGLPPRTQAAQGRTCVQSPGLK